MKQVKESDIQIMVADYLVIHYPEVVFHSDFGSGTKLSFYQASMQKRQNGGRRAWPDMFIAKPNSKYSGLFIELKRDGTRIKKKNGMFASEHIAEQAKILDRLKSQGYSAEFAVGFNEAKRIIDAYLEIK